MLDLSAIMRFQKQLPLSMPHHMYDISQTREDYTFISQKNFAKQSNFKTMKHFVKDNYFEVVTDVNNTWSKIKRIPDYRKELGVELFQR